MSLAAVTPFKPSSSLAIAALLRAKALGRVRLVNDAHEDPISHAPPRDLRLPTTHPPEAPLPGNATARACLIVSPRCPIRADSKTRRSGVRETRPPAVGARSSMVRAGGS